jgi:signal peptide peptidase SppA
MTPAFLQSREWLILQESLQAMACASEAFFSLEIPSKPKASLLSVSNGVATIDITGPLMRNPDAFDRYMLDATDMNDIQEAIDQAGSRPDVHSVMLNIDSPGGTVQGTPELAAAVADLGESKPVYAFSSGLMCSAAYWIASQAKAIYATPSARVGSIGVVLAVVDQSERLAKAGVKVEVFTSGKYKAIGHSAKPMTDEHRAHVQSQIDDVGADFRQAVTTRRNVPADAMEGQVFSGKNAGKVKLITATVKNAADAYQRLAQLPRG